MNTPPRKDVCLGNKMYTLLIILVISFKYT